MNSVFIIGGWSGNEHLSAIAEYKDNQWKQFGSMHQSRGSHKAILLHKSILVIGGISSGDEP